MRKVLKDGQGSITLRKNTELFLQIDQGNRSPLAVPGINTKASMQDVIDAVRESLEMDSGDRMAMYTHQKP